MYPPIPLSFFWAERFRGVGGVTRIFKISVEGTFTIPPSYWKQVFILQVCEEEKNVNFAFVHYELSNASSNWRQSKYKVTFLTWFSPKWEPLLLLTSSGVNELCPTVGRVWLSKFLQRNIVGRHPTQHPTQKYNAVLYYVVRCNSCSELTHLRCAKNAPTPFYCCKCPHPMGPAVDVEVVEVYLQSALDDQLLNDEDAIVRVEEGQIQFLLRLLSKLSQFLSWPPTRFLTHEEHQYKNYQNRVLILIILIAWLNALLNWWTKRRKDIKIKRCWSGLRRHPDDLQLSKMDY